MKYESIRDLAISPYIIQCKNSTSFVHFHTSIEIIYVVEGQIELSLNGTKYLLGKDEITFIDSYQPHSNKPAPNSITINLVAQQEFLTDYRLNTKRKKIAEVLKDVKFNQTVKPLLEEFIRAADDKEDLLIKGYLNIILGKLLKHYPATGKTSDKKREIVNIITYINENYQSPITLDSIASHFNYNKYYFSKLFNRFCNCSLSTYINIVRVQKVFERLAVQKRQSVTDIVFDCGFNSLSTFYRYQKLCKDYYNVFL